MGQQSATSDPFAEIKDQYRREVDGQGRRCQLITGHDGQHPLQRDGRRSAWHRRRRTDPATLGAGRLEIRALS
jgi:hypothetical protein